MKRKINRKIVDPKGYKPENEKNFTPFKVIPSNDITMDDVKSTILGIMLDGKGQAQGFEFMEPGQDYNFPNAEAVIEIPKYQMAGKINFKPEQNTVPPMGEPNLGGFPQNDLPLQYMIEQDNLATQGAETAMTQPMTDPERAGVMNQINGQEDAMFQNPEEFEFFNPYGGVDIPTAAFTLGSSIEEGNTWGTVGSALKLTSGLARNVLSGAGLAKRQESVMRDYKNKQRQYVTGENRPTYMQEGGKLEQALTGEYLFGMDEMNPMTMPNAEIETGEYIQHPNSEVQQAKGETHEKGGMDVALEEGTKILSDHLKIGGDKAKYFRDKFDIEVKASDTFATLLDKFNKKSGLQKIVDEQEEVIGKIDKQQKETEDEAAFGLNMQYLSGKMKELEEKKKPLEEARKILFDEAYKAQEKSKPKSERDESVFEDGGEIGALASKYGISVDRAKELIQQFQTGGTPDVSRYYQPLDVNTGKFGRQKLTRGNNLSVDPDEAIRRLRMQQESLPFLMQRSGVGELSNAGDFPELLRDPNLVDENGNPIIVDATTNPNSINRFQVGYNVYIDNALKAIQANPNMSKEEKDTLAQKLRSETFGEGTARDFDSIYGDFTSSRSGVALPALTQRDRELYGDKIKRIGDVVNPDGTIKDDFKDLSPEAKNYIQGVVKTSGDSSFDLGLIDIPQPAAPADTSTTATNTEANPTEQSPFVQNDYTRMGVFLMPEQNPLPPTSLQPHLKVNRRFDRVRPALISPEQNLEELRRQEASATDQINNLPDSQRIAALTALNANTQQNINRVVSETNKVNSQITSNADMQNAQTQRMEENAGAQDALSYEQRQLMALARTQNDFANYYNTSQANNVRNFNTINNLNMMNAMYDDFQFTGSGIEKTSPDIQFAFDNYVPRKEEPKKKKNSKKFGGRFKK